MLTTNEIIQAYEKSQKDIDFTIPKRLHFNPFTQPQHGERPNSVSVDDLLLGDSGKGSIASKINRLLNAHRNLFSLGPNGGKNAGHEAMIDGTKIVTHQLPMAVVEEGATALMTRGKVLDPVDLLFEIQHVESALGSQLPGSLLIDERILLNLDTHRGWETIISAHTDGSKGSTKAGIAPSYADVYLRKMVTLKDLLADNWEETLRDHYQFHEKSCRGFGQEFELHNLPIKTAHPDKSQQMRTVGTENEFIERLAEVRESMRKFVIKDEDLYALLKEVWNDPTIPVVIESAQGPGLDPWHGVSPDYTASRPMINFIGDPTYGIIKPSKVAVRMATTKTVYGTSVGSRKLPTLIKPEQEALIQRKFDEKGKSTQRLRDVIELPLPMLLYLRQIHEYNYLVTTHLDAGTPEGFNVISHYTDKETGQERPYLPYQDHLNQLTAQALHFDGWDGASLTTARSIDELPPELIIYLNFLGEVLDAPVLAATASADMESFLPWWGD